MQSLKYNRHLIIFKMMGKETQILRTNIHGECPVTALCRVMPLGECPSELREEVPEPGTWMSL